MTDTQSTPATPDAPKKIFKKVFWIIAIILGALGLDHYTFHYASGGVDVTATVTDSTIVVHPKIDTTITIAKSDTTKKDTIKKK